MDNFSIMKRNKNAEYKKKLQTMSFFNCHFFCPLDDATIVTPHKEFNPTQKIQTQVHFIVFFLSTKINNFITILTYLIGHF